MSFINGTHPSFDMQERKYSSSIYHDDIMNYTATHQRAGSSTEDSNDDIAYEERKYSSSIYHKDILSESTKNEQAVSSSAVRSNDNTYEEATGEKKMIRLLFKLQGHFQNI